MFVFTHVCFAVCAGTTTSCSSLLDSAIHEATVLRSQSQSTLSPELGGSAAALSELGDSGSHFLSAATQGCVAALKNESPPLRYHVSVMAHTFSNVFELKTSEVHDVLWLTVESALRDKTACCTAC